MGFDQGTRSLQIATPLGDNAVQLVGFSGEEEVSRLFSFQLSLISDNAAIDGADIVGKNVTFSMLEDDDETRRYFNGFVQRFSGGDEDEKGVRGYSATVVPWLWFLTQKSDCRIFQAMNVVDVISKVFTDLGFSDFETNVTGEHPEREYWVQYRETSFNFVSRLMEDEGIFYFFKHENGKHKLVLADHSGAFVDCKENSIDYPRTESGVSLKAHLRSWEHTHEFKSGGWAHTDYNFTTPSTSLMANEKTLMKFDKVGAYELYDYPGEHDKKAFGKEQAKRRIEELELDHNVVASTSDCKTLTPGGKFKVAKHRVKAEENKEFVIQRVRHDVQEGSYETGGSTDGQEYFNHFECFPSSQSFRPARITPKPLVGGIQTAVVTGPAGEEIYTDKYGRVKVQFHWDREGKKDENTTLWIRCKQSMSGNKWGFMAIPRIGQEVVVEFLEGDPDRPLITGSVYNAEQMPHYALPDEMTKSYIKTNSTKGGDGHNELMFEDKKDDERVYIHAEKNMDVRVKNDSKERIFGNRHQIIGWEKDGDKAGDQREMVYQDKHLNIKRHQVEHIEGNLQLMVGNGEASDGGQVEIVIEKDKLESIGGDSHLIVKGDRNEKFDGGLSQTIGGDSHLQVSGNVATQAGAMGEVHIKAGMKVIIEAGMQLSLVGPGGFIDIGPAGVTIQGVMVKINSGGSAGSGKGVKPKAAKEAKEAAPAKPELAHNSTSGAKSSK